MTILGAIGRGVAATNKSMRIVVLLYGINFIFAFIVALTFRSVLVSSFGHSLALEKTLAGFDFTVLSEFLAKDGGRLGPVITLAVWLALFYIVLSSFITGGVLSCLLQHDQPFSLKLFFGSCGEYLVRFSRLIILLGVSLVIVALVMAILLGVLYGALVQNADTEVLSIVLFLVFLGVFLVPILSILMAGDYAKLITVMENRQRMFKALWESMRFVFHNFPRVFGLQVMLFVVLGIILLAYILLTSPLATGSLLGIALMFVLNQAFVAGRAWTRVLTFASESELYKGLMPAPEALPSVTTETPPPEQAEVPTPLTILEPAVREKVRVRKPAKSRKIRRRRSQPRRRVRRLKNSS